MDTTLKIILPILLILILLAMMGYSYYIHCKLSDNEHSKDSNVTAITALHDALKGQMQKSDSIIRDLNILNTNITKTEKELREYKNDADDMKDQLDGAAEIMEYVMKHEEVIRLFLLTLSNAASDNAMTVPVPSVLSEKFEYRTPEPVMSRYMSSKKKSKKKVESEYESEPEEKPRRSRRSRN